ncbi:MAG: methyl-accepting chemotaxis protein, partial [Planctomycetes bacterium]|nr:methyl-accepting chemotaxis protein [Planctomycetota bacterium]
MVIPVVLAAGCVATSPIPPPEAPAYGTIAGAHNARIERLRTIYSRGVLEIRWSDETGRHFEQGSVDLWVALPRHTALRVAKLGEVVLWLGSDDHHYWLFDRFAQETTLVVGAHDEAPWPVHATAFTVRPLSLLDLMGLTPLPDGAALDVVFDAERDAWVLETVGAMNSATSQVASAVREQAEGAEQIRAAMENIKKVMAQAAYSTREQAAGGRQVRVAVENMNKIASQVGLATREQAEGSRQIIHAVERMNDQTQQVSHATAEQKKGGELVVKAKENISENARDHPATVR